MRKLNPSWIVIAAGVTVALHITKLPPAVAVLQNQLGISLVQAGFLLSTVQVAGMLLGLVVGLCADQWGLRRSMLAGLILIGSASILGAAGASFFWLLAFRAVEGLGLLLVVMPAPSLIRRSVPLAELQSRMGWWGAYMPFGSALGLISGPWMIGAFSWQVWWAFTGFVSLAAGLAVWAWIPKDEFDSILTRASHWRARLLATMHNRGSWLAAGSFMVYSAQWVSVVGFLPTIYARAGTEPRMAGLLTASIAAANMVGNIAAGRLLQRGWPARRCLQAGFVLMATCALIAFTQWGGQPVAPPWLGFAALVVFSAAGGMIPGSLFASVSQLASSQQTVSTTVGLMQQLSSFGQFAGPPLVAGVATAVGGWQWTWLVTGTLCVFGWLLAVAIHKTLQAQESSGSGAI